MAIEEFANCYVERVGGTVDAIIDDLRTLGADGIRNFLSWWNNLRDSERALVGLIATGITIPIVKAILVGVGGEVLGAAIIAFLGGASWVLLVRGFTDCENRL